MYFVSRKSKVKLWHLVVNILDMSFITNLSDESGIQAKVTLVCQLAKRNMFNKTSIYALLL